MFDSQLILDSFSENAKSQMKLSWFPIGAKPNPHISLSQMLAMVWHD